MQRLTAFIAHVFSTVLAMGIVVAAAPVWAADGGTIAFSMTVQAKKGPIYCHLFANDKGFPMDLSKSQTKVVAKVKGTQATCRFAKVKPGTYAIMAFHDLNSNGKLDTNWIGMPKEGVVSSNNAKGRMGPPSFKDASFKVADGAVVEQTLTLKYY